MRIAVTTPTGNVGSHVLRMLVRAGVRPLALARDPGRLDADLRDVIDVAAIDQRDADSTVAATKGVDRIYWVDPTTGSEDPLADYARATDAITAAVSRNGIRRVVFQSSGGAEKRHGAGEIDGLAATEIALDESDAEVTHLRCGFFFSNLELQVDAIRAGVIPVILPLDQPLPWVAPRDIAEVATGHLLAPERSQKRMLQAVHGPADLTWPDAAAIIADATGRPVRAERIDDEAMRDLLASTGMTPGLVEAVLGMSTGLRDDYVPELPRSVASTTPTTLASWAYDVLRPLL